MDALEARSPVRLSAMAEWIIAALFLCATVAVAALIVREMRSEPVFTQAAEPAPVLATVPAAIPARAVSVPVLPLSDGLELSIGQSVSAIASRLGRAAESGRQEIDRGLVGERLTRFYEYKGRHFILVFEPLERNGEAKLAAIYLRN